MVPFGLAALCMIAWGRYADATRERIWSTSLPLALTSISLLLTLATGSLWVTVLLLSLALIGNYAVKGPYWALVTETISRTLTERFA